jgi:hypothetical protein
MNRDTGHRPKIFGVDALVVLPGALFFYHIKEWTFFIFASFVVLLWILEQYGIFITSLGGLVKWWIGVKRPDLHTRETPSLW